MRATHPNNGRRIRSLAILGGLVTLCLVAIFMGPDWQGASQNRVNQRQSTSNAVEASDPVDAKDGHSSRRGKTPVESSPGKPPMAFLGGATSLDEEAVEFLGLTEEQVQEISRALQDARDGITNLALSRISEVSTDKLEIDYEALGFSMDPNSGGIKPDDAKLRIAASYSIPAMHEQGAEIEANLRSRLGLVMGDAGARIADEAKQHCEFLNFGRMNVNLLLIRNQASSSCSVYMEFRVPESGKLVGGDLLPFAAFNKRFGQFFESK